MIGYTEEIAAFYREDRVSFEFFDHGMLTLEGVASLPPMSVDALSGTLPSAMLAVHETGFSSAGQGTGFMVSASDTAVPQEHSATEAGYSLNMLGYQNDDGDGDGIPDDDIVVTGKRLPTADNGDLWLTLISKNGDLGEDLPNIEANMYLT